MDHQTWNRRRFLTNAGGTLGTALAATHWPAIAAPHRHAASGVARPDEPALHFLTEDEAADVDAVAAQIVPTDDTPGAREAAALYFIDRSLSTRAAGVAEPFRAGLREFREAFTAIQKPYYTKVDWEIGVSGLAGAHPNEPPRSRPYPMPPMPVKSSGVLLERGARRASDCTPCLRRWRSLRNPIADGRRACTAGFVWGTDAKHRQKPQRCTQ